jgi:hypothetical protein
MNNTILVEQKLTSDYVKFTVTRDNDLRIKVPVGTPQSGIDAWTRAGMNLISTIAPVDRTYRGKVRIGKSHLTMYNDAKTQSITVELIFK